jgi:hypothetical protein
VLDLLIFELFDRRQNRFDLSDPRDCPGDLFELLYFVGRRSVDASRSTGLWTCGIETVQGGN